MAYNSVTANFVPVHILRMMSDTCTVSVIKSIEFASASNPLLNNEHLCYDTVLVVYRLSERFTGFYHNYSFWEKKFFKKWVSYQRRMLYTAKCQNIPISSTLDKGESYRPFPGTREKGENLRSIMWPRNPCTFGLHSSLYLHVSGASVLTAWDMRCLACKSACRVEDTC